MWYPYLLNSSWVCIQLLMVTVTKYVSDDAKISTGRYYPLAEYLDPRRPDLLTALSHVNYV